MTDLRTPLTPEQRSRLQACRQKWVDLAHTTQPVDAKQVTERVLEFYAAFGQPAPNVVVCPGVISAMTDALTYRPLGQRLQKMRSNWEEWVSTIGVAIVVGTIWGGGAVVFIRCLLTAAVSELEGKAVDDSLRLLTRITLWGTLPAGIAAMFLLGVLCSSVSALVTTVCDRHFLKCTERSVYQSGFRSPRAQADPKWRQVADWVGTDWRSPLHGINFWQVWILWEFQRLHWQFPESMLRAVWQICINSDRPQDELYSSHFARDFLNRRDFEDWQAQARRADQRLWTEAQWQFVLSNGSWRNAQLLARFSLEISLLAPYFTMLDFCEAELGYQPDPVRWKALRHLMQSTGYVIAGGRTCWVGDRPICLKCDRQGRFHADGQPALAFADGARLYAHHGVFLPPKYGQTPIAHWQPRWLLQETNATLRQILIQGIGYERIARTLQSRSVDCWREYVLCRIPTHPDVEPFLLLQMTCPSTRQIHVLRVPPTLRTAREAARWVNWDIDPTDFAIET
ncbi:DUF6745 domain-containing protein [Thermoleptolyngbya sp. PKUAC-SCTB121]|uniref:DUF6745 domain-containing protein n=1 Tax=Thermoleptolyngbya sp. PKUAC-SCTB121 TaxID=2811482 RepID=UPI001966A554|nr:hypothetical protein [Thermoleptolyngbya sp. PKUAC-SCTB121]